MTLLYIESFQTGRSQLGLLPNTMDLGCYYFPYRKFDLKKLYYKQQQSYPHLSDNAMQIAILVQRTQHCNYVIVVYLPH